MTGWQKITNYVFEKKCYFNRYFDFALNNFAKSKTKADVTKILT